VHQRSLFLRPLLALAALLVAVSASAATLQTIESGVLKVCLYPGFAPFAFKDAEGHWGGADVDYLKAFAAQENLAFQTVEVTEFNNIWTLPGQGKCDIAATGISDLEQRREQTGDTGVWSDHYYRVVRAFAIVAGTTLDGVEDLRGKTVIVTPDSTADLDLRHRMNRAGIDTVTIEGTDDEVAAATKVRDGKGTPFAFGAGLGSVERLVELLGGLEVAWPHCTMLADNTESDEPFSLVVRAKSAGLADALNKYIATAKYGLARPDLKCLSEP
jgi:ABC-type amino acid transport substrate-binding protein